MQQLSRTDTSLQSFDGVEQSMKSSYDIGKDVPRFALIEISAIAAGGQLKLSFGYNKHMKHQDSIKKWASECVALLQEAPRRLMDQMPQKTLSEFPLLRLAYYGMENLRNRLRDSALDVDLQDVEDIYPCSPMQRGLLLSQMRDPEKYAYKAVFHVESPHTGSGMIDPQRLCNAWQAVVRRHVALRTVFIDTVGDEGLMDQVVLRSAPGRVQMLQCNEDDALETIQNNAVIDYNEKKPQHRLTVCITPSGRVVCRLEISHVISDGSSLPILLGDLADAYGDISIVAAKPVPLYREYVAYIQSQPRSESIRYWKGYLDGAEPCLFPAITDGKADEERFLGSYIISLDGVAEVNQYCADSGITLATLLQFVWALVLRSYTGSEEVLFGYLASGRDIPVENIEQAVGAFINMLVCRLVLPADTEVGEALDTIQTDLADAMAHQSSSLAEIQHELQIPGATLFNTAFTYQVRRAASLGQDARLSRSALQYHVLDVDDPSEYSVAVNVEATEKAVQVHFSYWTNVVSDAQMKNVASTFKQVVHDLVASGPSDRTVGELDFVGSAGIQQISAWNDCELPRVERCAHEIIAEHTVRNPPSTPAVCGWDASFTYPELDEVTTTLAGHLVSLGVGPEVFVPLCFEKSAWTVVAQVAVLKAGGAFVNLDPEHPDNRLRNLVEDVGAKVALCSAKHKTKTDNIASTAFVVSAESIAALRQTTPSPTKTGIPTTVKPSNPAYVIFTSGTTGKPKGTVIEHAAICTSALSHAEAMFMRSDSRVFQFAAYTFDASVMETLSCLLVGGCVCIPSDEERINDISGAVRRMNVTWTLLTPSVASTIKPESVPCLKTLVTGGEAMSAGHVARWGTQCALVNAYGPTECAIIATTSTKVDESHQVCNTDHFNIGTAVGGRVWVADPNNSDCLVPIGALGELVIEGRLVARGYLNNEEQTAKAFIRSPRWTQNAGFPESMFQHGDRMYRTGDLVRYNSDGSISYVSRKDTQIKLNGRRIELGEIEFQCRAGLPDDSQAAVEIVEPTNSTTTKSLAVFFCLPPPSGEPAATSFSLLPMSDVLRNASQNMEAYLSGLLPAYMVPQLFIPVSAMPWTSAGKLDRRLLRRAVAEAGQSVMSQYRLSAAGAAVKHGAPTTDMEKTLQALWESVLQLPSGSVSPGDNFFSIGGDSLTAMQLVGAARAQRIVLSVLDIFEAPILADMSRACGGLEATAIPLDIKSFDLVQCPRSELDGILQEASTQCLLPAEQIRDIYPCSPLQEGLVALANKQTGAYVAIITLKLAKDVNMNRFKSAWQEVVDATDTLRTRIVHTAAAGFLQVVAAPEPIVWHEEIVFDDAVLKGKEIGSQNGGRLTRYAIVQEPGEDHSHFIWAIHHSLYDGWSLPLIARQVQDLYHDASGGEGPAARASYAGFIHYLVNRDMAASEKFWKDSLRGAASISHFPQLPAAVANHNKQPNFRMESHQFSVSRDGILVNVTVPTLIRAAWAIVMAAHTGIDDVVIGETLSGRNIDLDGVAEMAGPTFTTVPTRVQVSRDMRLAEFLQIMHSMASRVVPHQHMGLQHIKGLNQDCAAACEFQNLLTIQSSSRQQEEQQQGKEPDWDFQGGSSTEGFFTHPLVLDCYVSQATVDINFHFDENVLSTWQVDRLVHQFEAVLKRLAGSQDVPLGDIRVISPEDEALISKWNPALPEDAVVESSIGHLFLEQASKQPDRAGICAWDTELTYREIEDYASRLAFRLKQLGVGPETLVPVCLTRSSWAVVSLMGILLAGGAFVPLDPAHPLSRQKDMLESIMPALIICSPEHASRFDGIVDTHVLVDGDMVRNLPLCPPESSLASTKPNPDSTAYVLFTSGSTGRPKGVVVAHRDFCSSSRAYASATHMDASSRVFNFASLTFDVALMEVLTPLTMGACVCVPGEEERLHDLGNAIATLRATWAFLTPSVANLLNPETVRSTLKTLVCGGEAMHAETVARWADHVELMNGYGPTEACVLTIVNPLVSLEREATAIGHGTPATRTWVLDTTTDTNSGTRLAPVGAAGELAVSGPVLARGYLNDPEKTAKAFVESPAWACDFADVAIPSRIYRTGDLVRYRSDGALEFLGRRDGQVKVNGQRLELGEIENRLIADRNVRLALVMQPKTGPCKKQLVGVVTLEASPDGAAAATSSGAGAIAVATGGGGDCQLVDGPPERMARIRGQVTEVRNRLADILPPYMVPAMWIALESLPIVVSGKLDRVRVARWVEGLDDATHERINKALGLSEEDDEEVELTGPAKTLMEICAKELRLPADRIKSSQSFVSLGKFSLVFQVATLLPVEEHLVANTHGVYTGGDSITAMGVISRARNAKITISLQDVLRSKSLARLAQLAKVSSSPGVSKVQNNEQNEVPFTLSPIQTMYMKSAAKHNGEARFNQSFSLGASRKVTVDTIKRAMDSIVQRHAMLRSRYAKNADGKWEQRTAKVRNDTLPSPLYLAS